LSAVFQAVAFAGGGNRCYWQGGFWEAVMPALGMQPRLVVGVSAGAWTACYSLLGVGHRVVDLVVEGCSTGRRNFEWRSWRREGSPWPVAGLYRSLLEAVVDGEALARLRSEPEVLIALARKPRRLPLALALPLGVTTYQIEKKWFGPVHPRGGRVLGFRSEFVPVRTLPSPAELVNALMASASVPPFMPVGRVGGMRLSTAASSTTFRSNLWSRSSPRVAGPSWCSPAAIGPCPPGQVALTRSRRSPSPSASSTSRIPPASGVHSNSA
jgi:Patatin-like phospholipase